MGSYPDGPVSWIHCCFDCGRDLYAGIWSGSAKVCRWQYHAERIRANGHRLLQDGNSLRVPDCSGNESSSNRPLSLIENLREFLPDPVGLWVVTDGCLFGFRRRHLSDRLFHDEIVRTGTLHIGGQSVLRVCSFGGEPKGLGLALSVALCILQVFSGRMGFAKWKFRLASIVLLSVILLTASTSAFMALLVAGAAVFTLSLIHI